MMGIIKEEILTTVRKKRFIILMALVFIGAIVMTVITKNGHWNDQTFLFAMLKYIANYFNPAVGLILIFSVYRRKYTRSSIEQVEEHGVKRSAGVIARAIAGSIIIWVCYSLMVLFILLLGLVFGANNSGMQIAVIATKLGLDCIAAITAYVVSLFWLYLFAFPIVPWLVDFILIFFMPWFFVAIESYSNILFRVGAFISPKCGMDVFFTSVILANPQWLYLLACIGHIVLAVLLSMLVFKFKKKERKKRKKKGEAEEVAEEVAADPEIKEILEQAELTEGIVE